MEVCLGAPTAEVILCYVKWHSWVLIWWWHKALAKHLRAKWHVSVEKEAVMSNGIDGRMLIIISLFD